MKTKIYISLLFLMSGLTYGQSDTNTKTKIEHIDVKVVVETLEELNSVINKDDFDEFFDISLSNQNISFELKCKKGQSESLSYKVTGSLNEKSAFKNQIEDIKEMCKSYLLN